MSQNDFDSFEFLAHEHEHVKGRLAQAEEVIRVVARYIQKPLTYETSNDLHTKVRQYLTENKLCLKCGHPAEPKLYSEDMCRGCKNSFNELRIGAKNVGE